MYISSLSKSKGYSYASVDENNLIPRKTARNDLYTVSYQAKQVVTYIFIDYLVLEICEKAISCLSLFQVTMEACVCCREECTAPRSVKYGMQAVCGGLPSPAVETCF